MATWISHWLPHYPPIPIPHDFPFITPLAQNPPCSLLAPQGIYGLLFLWRSVRDCHLFLGARWHVCYHIQLGWIGGKLELGEFGVLQVSRISFVWWYSYFVHLSNIWHSIMTRVFHVLLLTSNCNSKWLQSLHSNDALCYSFIVPSHLSYTTVTKQR